MIVQLEFNINISRPNIKRSVSLSQDTSLGSNIQLPISPLSHEQSLCQLEISSHCSQEGEAVEEQLCFCIYQHKICFIFVPQVLCPCTVQNGDMTVVDLNGYSTDTLGYTSKIFFCFKSIQVEVKIVEGIFKRQILASDKMSFRPL